MCGGHSKWLVFSYTGLVDMCSPFKSESRNVYVGPLCMRQTNNQIIWKCIRCCTKHLIGIHRFTKSNKSMFNKCFRGRIIDMNSPMAQKWSGRARLNIIAINQRITLQGRTWKKRVRDENVSMWVIVRPYACACHLNPDCVRYIEIQDCCFSRKSLINKLLIITI